MAQEYLKLFILALVPAATSAAVFLMIRKTGFGKISRRWQQIIIGIIFGILVILETRFGVGLDGYTISVRDASPVCAGLIFGGPAGIIAGAIGSLERCLTMAFVTGLNMRLVCSTFSTLFAGALAAAVRKFIFEDRRATAMSGFIIAAIAWIMHLCILLIMYSRDLTQDYYFVVNYSLPAVICNGLAAAIGIIAVRVIDHDRPFGERGESKGPARLRKIMLATVACAMAASIVLNLTSNKYTTEASVDDTSMRHVLREISVADIYLDMYMEFVVLALLYAFTYVIMRKIVNNNILTVNEKLKKVIGNSIALSQDNDQMGALVSVEKNFERFTDYIAEKIDEEMKLARNIQMSAMPESSRITSELAVNASVEPAREVGGDFYDYFVLDDDRVAVLMADVSGKGIGAALFMMKARDTIRKLAEEGLEINEIFNRANGELCDEKGPFVTVWMGIINLSTGSVDYADAGHGCPLLKVPGKGFEYLDSEPELVMAAIPGKTYKVQHLQMVPGSRLYLFTDGVTEANNISEEMYGEERLQRCLTEQCAGLKGGNLISIVREDMAAFAGEAEQFDDVTMLVADYMGSMEDAHCDSRTFRASRETLDDATEFISGMLAKADCNPVNEMQVNVAFEEMFINIASYAYPDGEGEATVEVKVKSGVAQIKLTDSGLEFNPLEREMPDLTLPAEKKPLGGLGITMVLDSMDYVHYEYENGRNVFTMKKILD